MTEQKDKPDTQEPSDEGENQQSPNTTEEDRDQDSSSNGADEASHDAKAKMADKVESGDASEASHNAKVKMADKVESGGAPYDYSGELENDPSNGSGAPASGPAGYSLPNLMALLAIAVTVGVIYQGLIMFQDISHKVDDLNSSVALVAKSLMESRRNGESTAAVITRAELKKSLVDLDAVRQLGNPIVAGKAEKLQNDIRNILADMGRPASPKSIPVDSTSEDIKAIITPAPAIGEPVGEVAPAVVPDEPAPTPATATEKPDVEITPLEAPAVVPDEPTPTPPTATEKPDVEIVPIEAPAVVPDEPMTTPATTIEKPAVGVDDGATTESNSPPGEAGTDETTPEAEPNPPAIDMTNEPDAPAQ